LCKCLLSNNVLTVRDIAEHINIDAPTATEIISKLLKYNMITKKFQNMYVKNRQFVEWLKEQVATSINRK
jgi:predicted transcriptional regulator